MISTNPDLYEIPTQAAGRLAIVARPRGGDWLDDDVARWKRLGITTVVSLLEADEAEALDLSQEARVVAAAGIDFVAFPISDRGTPTLREPLTL